MMRWVLRLLRFAMGGVFLYAAYTKLREPWLMFAMAIDAYQLLPEWAVLAVARTLPWFELALGLVLLSGYKMKYAAAAASGLLGAFFAVMVWAFLKGMNVDCGCFGAGDPLGPRTLIRDGILLAGALWLTVLAFRPVRAPATARDETPVLSAKNP